jgi:hypothetical protein
MRNIAIFAGGSITMGLGLELEMRPKYNDHEWLKENGLKQPLPRDEEDKVYWRQYRYSKIVSERLGLTEFNIHDKHEYQIGGNAMDTLWYLNRDVEKFSDLMKDVKYVFLEVGFIRWWDKDIHGINNDNRFPSTVDEIVKFVSDNRNDYEISSVALEWLSKLDENVFWEESFNRFKILKEMNPEASEMLVYVMNNKKPVEAHIFNQEKLKNFIEGFSSLINLNLLKIDKMSYNEYINQD